LAAGVTSGIGCELAVKCAKLGAAHVICACRNLDKCKPILERTKAAATNKECVVESEVLDLSSLASVKQFADKIRNRFLPVSLLINNAGVMQPDEEHMMTKDGIDLTVQTNALAPYMLAKLLIPTLQRYGAGKMRFF